MPSPLKVWVTCAGVVIGSAVFDRPEGIAHAHLVHGPGYPIALDAATRLGVSFGRTQYWSPGVQDFAEVAAARWTGGRLALADEMQRELSVNNIAVIQLLAAPSIERMLQVVADFRPDMARVEALLNSRDASDGRTRPAA